MATAQQNPTGIRAFLTRRRFNFTDFITYLYLIVGVFVMFGPVLWLIMSSFKDESLIRSGDPTFLPYRQQTTTLLHPSIVEYDNSFYGVRLGNASVSMYELPASNGIVYGVDAVIVDSDLDRSLRRLGESSASLELEDFEFIDEVPEGAEGTLLDVALSEGNLSTFPEILLTAGLEALLLIDTQQTFLVPTERAFATLTRRYGENLLIALAQPENQEITQALLQRHTLNDAYTVLELFELRGDRVTTVGEDTLRVNFDTREMVIYEVSLSNLFVDQSRMVLNNLQASNGYIHGIDQLLLTPELESEISALPPVEDSDIPDPIAPITLEGRDNLVNTALSIEDLTVMGQVLQNSGPQDILAGSDRYTLFVPTNEAIAAFTEQHGTALFAPENADILDQVVRLHLLEGGLQQARLFRQFYQTGEPMPMLLDGAWLPVDYVRGDEIRTLAQVGPPDRANYAFIDADNPDEGVVIIATFNEAPDVLNILLEPLRELHFSFDNYTDGLDAFDFWTYFTNSTIVTVVATMVTLLINSMAAFGLSKYKFAGRDVIFIIIISTLMVPVSVILIPAFLVITEIGWNNSLWGLIIPGAATPTGVFLLRQYMLTIPDELIDAARIDGASEWRIYWQVILPLARPALAVLAIFSVMWRWNDFLWPLIVVSRNDKFTLPVGLNAFQGALDSSIHLALAMTVLTLLPITIVFAFLQQYITSGIATTGMK